MAKIYYRMYKDKVESGVMTIEEVLALVPEKWRDAVRELFMGE